jgi:chaperonin GroES
MSQQTPNIRPLADRIVIEPKEIETKTTGGIVIPDTADKDKPMQGTVVAVGAGKYIDGKMQPLQIQPGEKVLFGKYSGTAIKLNEKEYLIMREDDVLGVVN